MRFVISSWRHVNNLKVQDVSLNRHRDAHYNDGTSRENRDNVHIPAIEQTRGNAMIWFDA